ncbi:MAG: helix-turn-helix domain-containing protein, partial [Euryarchaeota archaeon]
MRGTQSVRRAALQQNSTTKDRRDRHGGLKMMFSVLPVPSARDASRVNDIELIIKRLNEFGLSEKDAQLYVHLLKYGPKRAVDLARSLKTYSEDVNRRCARLIDVGMYDSERLRGF